MVRERQKNNGGVWGVRSDEFKKGDKVIVNLGKDKGKKGKIEKILYKKDSIIVSGVNIFKRHLKPQGQGKPGGIVDLVKPLRVSKVSILCPKCRSRWVRANVLRQQYVCRRCGKVWLMEH